MKQRIFMFILALALAPTVNAQVLTEWVESNPANNPNQRELGYPVPIPVGSPLPFDGFRSYMALHARHQDLAMTTPWVHGEELIETRNGRMIWAYRLGDEDYETIYGLPEPATLTNGGIHAREWQTPETVTGILELIATHEEDNHFYDYLRDNVNMVVIPSLNIDGFLQTQRYPFANYLQSDPDFPATSPRDGRMRRKNMLNVDENLLSTGDHLLGVDLNRNNPPFWSTTPSRSSSNVQSIVHHGAFAQSEPETQALDLAAQLGPIEQLRIYTDVHSFSQVHFWSSNSNARLRTQTQVVLDVFSNHHFTFPAAKWYISVAPGVNSGIGTTDEYFTHTYQVPSWTLEIEPSGNFHPTLPGGGADYGGTNVNGHDGFILPESQIRRVREELAQSFAAVFYRQSGPPNVQAVRFIDVETQSVVFEAEWDLVDDQTRVLYKNQLQALQLDRDYVYWVGYNKPMRWREEGEVVLFPGQLPGFLSASTDFDVGEQTLTSPLTNETWQDHPGGAPDGYRFYEDDALAAVVSFPGDETNDAAINGSTEAVIKHHVWDMTAMLTDSDPSTVVYWGDGHWNNYENWQGQDSDFGGIDQTISFEITDEILDPPFVLEPGIAAAWGDIDRDGEGFILEILDGGLAIMFWFTYNDDGEQDWYIGVGEIRGNRLMFPEVLRVSGGVFGDDFNPDLVTETPVGSARFIWSDCETGFMDWQIGSRHGRQNLRRLTSILGLDCGPPQAGPIREEAVFSGAWGDPTHDGEGYTVEILDNDSALVFWFSFGPDGKRRWYFSIGRIEDGKLIFDNMLTTVGGFFAENLVPADVDEVPWGTLELDLTCEGGTATYTSVEEGFEAGQQNVRKLTNMPGLECTP